MKINIFKSIIVFLFTLLILLTLIVLYDLANYDSSYIISNYKLHKKFDGYEILKKK